MKPVRPILVLLLCFSLLAVALTPSHAQTTKKKVYTKGTQQMAGGNGLFGQTYTVVGPGDYGPINFTLLGAEYSVARFCMSSGSEYAPKADEKLLVIHYRVKNPNTTDMYFGSRGFFQAVDANDNTIQDCGDSRRADSTQTVGETIKPGQGIADLVTYIVVPANTVVPKLILQLGRAGTQDLVTRYTLGAAPNVVKPIPAPYADPADKTGATPLAQIPGTIGTTYQAGYFDLTVDSLALAPGPFGDLTADDGKQFLVATISATNRSFGQQYYSGTFVPTLTTSDDKITDFNELKADHDDPFEGRQIDPGETVRERIVLQVPKDATLQSLSIAEAVDNTGGRSKAIVFDVSNLK